MNLADIRREYTRARLTRESLASEPLEQFHRWLEEAVNAGVLEPTAMSLATVTAEGRPLLRSVLLKGLDERGFLFFTNLESRKARHIAENPHVCLHFSWLALERQVIVSGEAARISTADALRYFVTRPRESQLAAWVSQQSTVIGSRQLIESAWQRMKEKFAGGEIPLPPFWGGYRVRPERIEFWQGGAHRLHDRFDYTRSGAAWSIARLAP